MWPVKDKKNWIDLHNPWEKKKILGIAETILSLSSLSILSWEKLLTYSLPTIVHKTVDHFFLAAVRKKNDHHL